LAFSITTTTMPPRSKALALPPMAEESTAKLLPALSAQLN